MEKIAIISDVHGNKKALETVLLDIKAKNISNIFCLGDSVTKCANPDAVIDILKDHCKVILKGNCDESISNDNAYKRKFWSRVKIGEDRAQFLKNLPVMYDFYLSGHLIRLFHSSPFSLSHIYNPLFSNSNSRNEISDPLTLFANTKFIGKTHADPIPDIVGYGHIHTQNLFRIKNKTIFNPGSVGMSIEMQNNNDISDETNRFSSLATYTILEGNFNSRFLSGISINMIRIPYDINKEIHYLECSDMPGKDKIIISLKTATSN